MQQAKELKIVFTGNCFSGKAQALKQLSDVDVKSTKTIGYGSLTLNKRSNLNLYCTIGGQRAAGSVCPVLCRDALGLVILVDHAQKNPLAELEYYLSINSNYIHKMPTLIGITHTSEDFGLDVYKAYLKEKKLSLSVFKTDVKSRMGMLKLLQALIVEIEKNARLKAS